MSNALFPSNDTLLLNISSWSFGLIGFILKTVKKLKFIWVNRWLIFVQGRNGRKGESGDLIYLPLPLGDSSKGELGNPGYSGKPGNPGIDGLILLESDFNSLKLIDWNEFSFFKVCRDSRVYLVFQASKENW